MLLLGLEESVDAEEERKQEEEKRDGSESELGPNKLEPRGWKLERQTSHRLGIFLFSGPFSLVFLCLKFRLSLVINRRR